MRQGERLIMTHEEYEAKVGPILAEYSTNMATARAEYEAKVDKVKSEFEASKVVL
jgi:hypothetical protein